MPKKMETEEFKNMLKCFWRDETRETLRKFNRSLPLGDMIVDRWEKAQILGFGEGTSVYDSCIVLGEVTVGKNTWIGPFTVLDGSGGLEIGDNCSIAAGVQIYSHDSVRHALSGGEQVIERSPTRIGSRCYLGPNAVVQKGVEIGDGSVIGANSLVQTSIPESAFACGVPAAVKRTLSRNRTEERC